MVKQSYVINQAETFQLNLPKIGAFLGFAAGIFTLSFWGIILGSFIGAFLGELVARRKPKQALGSALGAFLGLIAGTLFKIIVSLVMVGFFIASLF